MERTGSVPGAAIRSKDEDTHPLASSHHPLEPTSPTTVDARTLHTSRLHHPVSDTPEKRAEALYAEFCLGMSPKPTEEITSVFEAAKLGQWKHVIELTTGHKGEEEAVWRATALLRLGDITGAGRAVDEALAGGGTSLDLHRLSGQGHAGPALDRLFTLRDECEADVKDSSEDDLTVAITEELVDNGAMTVTESRILRVNLLIAHHHVNKGESDYAVATLKRCVAKHPSCVALHSALGRLLLSIGDMSGAEAEFDACSKLLGKSRESSARWWMDKGHTAVCVGRYEAAAEHFNRAATLSDSDEWRLDSIAAANNHAVALLFNRRAADAIEVLENAIKDNPALALHQGLVFNLTTLWELAGSDVRARKLMLKRFIKERGPEGFDEAAIKL